MSTHVSVSVYAHEMSSQRPQAPPGYEYEYLYTQERVNHLHPTENHSSHS